MNLDIVQVRVLMDTNQFVFVPMGDDIVDWMENEFARKNNESLFQSKRINTNHRL